jgi:hypothetical protein
MGVTSSFFNKKQRVSQGNSTSSDSRNKGSIEKYGGQGNDESQQGDGASSSGTTPPQTTTTTPTPEQGGTTTQGSPIITEQRTRLTGANDATKSMLASQGGKPEKDEGNEIPIPDRVSYATLGDIISELEKRGITLPKKDEEAERKRKLRASLGDGLSALASAFFVNAGGLPTYDPKDNAYNRLKAELKEGDAKREKQRAEWLAEMERAVARNRAEVDAVNAHNLATYKAQVDESDKKRQQANADRAYNLELNKFNTSTSQWQQKFDHEKHVDEETLKNNRAKVSKATAAANKSSANAQRYKIAVSKAWAVLQEKAKTDKDLATRIKTSGNPKFNSRGKHAGEYYNPTIEQKLDLIMQYGEAQEVFDAYWDGKVVDDGNNQKVMPGVQPSKKMPGVK